MSIHCDFCDKAGYTLFATENLRIDVCESEECLTKMLQRLKEYYLGVQREIKADKVRHSKE
jgi:hypothetical protein